MTMKTRKPRQYSAGGLSRKYVTSATPYPATTTSASSTMNNIRARMCDAQADIRTPENRAGTSRPSRPGWRACGACSSSTAVPMAARSPRRLSGVRARPSGPRVGSEQLRSVASRARYENRSGMGIVTFDYSTAREISDLALGKLTHRG